jgi:hypothetical protein
MDALGGKFKKAHLTCYRYVMMKNSIKIINIKFPLISKMNIDLLPMSTLLHRLGEAFPSSEAPPLHLVC